MVTPINLNRLFHRYIGKELFHGHLQRFPKGGDNFRLVLFPVFQGSESMLPGIDEVFGIVATGGTLLHDYKKGESLPNSIVHAIDAKDVYRNCSEEYEDMDVLQIAQNVASDYATQPAYTDPMPVQQGETELEQIEHLHQLKEKGILTEKEFQEKKKQLLSQL